MFSLSTRQVNFWIRPIVDSFLLQPKYMTHMKRGFALMELPIVLFVMFGVGLFVAFVYSLFSGPAPWYAWLICGLIPPVTFLLVGSIGELIVDPKKPKEDKIHNQTSGAGEDD